MSWQGYVRVVARDYEEVIVSSTAGHEPIYADFCDLFVPHRVEGLRDCWFLRDSQSTELDRVELELAGIDLRRREAGWQVERIRPSGFIPPADQHFVRYGRGLSALSDALIFDVVVHARQKKSHNQVLDCLNWNQREWDALVSGFLSQELRVAAIGTPTAALLPLGATDLRGSDLQIVTDVLSAARVAVGPSSGPMHLASLCGTPHLVWTVAWNSSLWSKWGSSRERYEKIWNPFAVSCRILEPLEGQMINHHLVLEEFATFFNKLERSCG